jgi:hypothetical protein
MRHPSTRGERRYAREVARNRRRKHLYLIHLSSEIPHEQNTVWNHGGKQCFAHGNRCAHSMADRHEHRRQLKRSRRLSDMPRIEGAWLQPCQNDGLAEAVPLCRRPE